MKKRLLSVLLLLGAFGASGAESKTEGTVTPPPPPPPGRLVFVGGGEENVEVTQTMIGLAGGNTAKLALFPVLSDVGASYQRFFSGFGCRSVDAVSIAERADAEDVSVVKAIAESDLLFFPSGNPSKIFDTIHKTSLHGGIQAAYQRGAVIAGTGAGAVIWGTRMITSGESPRAVMDGGGFVLKPGMELAENTVLDTLFVKNSRIGRLLLAMGQTPGARGIGIDSQTGVMLGDDSIQATGQGTVAIFEPDRVEINNANLVKPGTPLALSGVRMHVIAPGDIYSKGAKSAAFSQTLSPKATGTKPKPYLLAIGSSTPIDLPSVRDFVRVTGGNQSSLLLFSGEASLPTAKKWQDFLLRLGASQVNILGATDLSDEALAVHLQKATGIFLVDDASGTLAQALTAQKGRFGLYLTEYSERLPVAAAGKGVRILGDSFVPEPMATSLSRGLGFLPGYLFENNVWGHNALNRLLSGQLLSNRATGFALNAFNSLAITGGQATVVGKSPVFCFDADEVSGFRLSERPEHPPAFSNMAVHLLPPTAAFDLTKHSPRF